MRALKVEFVGDVLTQPLARLADLDEFSLTVKHHGIDQHFQVLLSDSSADVLICHTQYAFFSQGNSDVGDAASQYCAAVSEYLKKNNAIVVLNTVSVPPARVVGMDQMLLYRQVADINRHIADLAAQSSMVSVADIGGVVATIGLSRAVSEQNDLVMRMPYTGAVVPGIVQEYSRVIRERLVARKKVLVVDADNTLWAGVVGEDGINGIDVGSHFPGLMYRRFQEQLLQLKRSGVVLALSSKNNIEDVEEAFTNIDMPLSLSDFTVVKANWNPKSQNIQAIAEELNVGLDSMVFVDGNPFEIEEVSSFLPAVGTYRFEPKNASAALGLLSSIKDLGTWSVTREDVAKSEQYQQEKERKQQKQSAHSIEDYIRSLEINIQVGVNRVAEVKRIAQLTNKTNQFNLTTRRYSEAEMTQTMSTSQVFDFRVVDKFGDMGIVGVAVVAEGVVETFLMSCRALGRQIEGHMLDYICEAVVAANLKALYIRSKKNDMVSTFYEQNGFTCIAEEEGVKQYGQRQAVERSLEIPMARVE